MLKFIAVKSAMRLDRDVIKVAFPANGQTLPLLENRKSLLTIICSFNKAKKLRSVEERKVVDSRRNVK